MEEIEMRLSKKTQEEISLRTLAESLEKQVY